MDYDVIIVGARAAGAPLAMNLARKGHSVLALDRGTFGEEHRPAETMQGHAIQRLQGWGLLDRLLATNATPVWRILLSSGDTTAELPVAGELPIVNPRRDVLDKLLVTAAREAGAEVREQTEVTGLLRDSAGTVVGVRATGPGGDFEARARVVVGADGASSLVAAEAGAEKYDELPGSTCWLNAVWSGVAHDGVEAYFSNGCATIVYPTNEGQVSVSTIFPAGEWDRVKDRPLEAMAEALDAVPGLAMRLRCGKPATEWTGGVWPGSYYRVPHGPGWALAGDAGYLKDPVLGQGLNDAFRDADMLADAIDAAFTGARPFEAAMAEYHHYRDTATKKIYRATQDFATLQVTGQMIRAVASYAAQQGAVAI
ncbi:MAG: NAD(P)/FAD-dependent oxidoreductase [Dehalococcoidia bacterium]|nr:NAD(P)/FAD-dependent oxidoreductase [Dehalococcoidia bacterium]